MTAPGMLVLLALALALLFVDRNTRWLDPTRAWIDSAAQPLRWLSNTPSNVAKWSDQNLLSRSELVADNQRLKTEVLVLKGEVQRVVDLSVENARLRNLLSARELLKTRVLVAELIGVSTMPLRHQVTINRGARDGVFVGQAVLDGDGLMGQVIAVDNDRSQVMLISDARHAIPVQIAEFGTRLIAEGTGDYQRLQLRHVPPTLNIKEHDLLLSSGLGGRFPAGYPVGRVATIERKSGQDFVEVTVLPTAQLNRSRHLLLLFTEVNPVPRGGIDSDIDGDINNNERDKADVD
ncbi:MAG: rod shape-determining protein MreC [Porticoccaceae bacterium]